VAGMKAKASIFHIHTLIGSFCLSHL